MTTMRDLLGEISFVDLSDEYWCVQHAQAWGGGKRGEKENNEETERGEMEMIWEEGAGINEADTIGQAEKEKFVEELFGRVKKPGKKPSVNTAKCAGRERFGSGECVTV